MNIHCYPKWRGSSPSCPTQILCPLKKKKRLSGLLIEEYTNIVQDLKSTLFLYSCVTTNHLLNHLLLAHAIVKKPPWHLVFSQIHAADWCKKIMVHDKTKKKETEYSIEDSLIPTLWN